MRTVIYGRRRAPAPLPKFWRPKLEEGTKLHVKIAHHDLVARLADGTATLADLWDWMETGFTYSQMMRMLHEDGECFTQEAEQAIAAQLDTYPAVCQRLRITRKAWLEPAELDIARQAAMVFDALIDLDRNGIAVAAVEWSDAQMASIRRVHG